MAINLIDSDDITVSQSGSNIELNTATSISEILSKIDDLKPTVLYSDSSGSESVILSESANNYSRFVISCTISNQYFQDFIIENSNNPKIVGMQTAAGHSIGSVLNISGTNMSLSVIYREYYTDAVIKIIKVVGFK